MDLITILTQNNFSEKEAKIYLTCLKLKTANISTIARISGEKRSTTYSIIKELQKKKIINEIDKNKISSYSAIPPENLIKQIEEQVEVFKKILPAFSAFTEKFGVSPKIQFFEGLEGIVEIYNDTISSQVDIHVFLGSTKFPKYISKYLKRDFLPEKIKRDIKSKVIISDTKLNQKNIKTQNLKKLNRDRRICDGLSFPENIIINIYGPNKILVAVFTENEPFGLIISSHYLYETLLNIFNFIRKETK